VTITLVSSYKTHQSAAVRLGGLFGWTVRLSIIIYQYHLVKVMQRSQQEAKTNPPQLKHIDSGGWTGSRKSSLAPARLSPDYTVDPDRQNTRVLVPYMGT